MLKMLNNFKLWNDLKSDMFIIITIIVISSSHVSIINTTIRISIFISI